MKISTQIGPVVVLCVVLVAVAGCQDSAPDTSADQQGSTEQTGVAQEPEQSETDSDSSDTQDDSSQAVAPNADSSASTVDIENADQGLAVNDRSEPAEMDAPPADRALPDPPDNENVAASDGEPEDDLPAWEPDGPTAEELAGKAFLAPPDATSLSKQGRLWINPKAQRVYVDGYVALKRGALEMFACPVGTKEHESIVAVLAKSREVHAALLAIEATPGAPVRFRPEFSPPSGQVIRVWVCWYDENDKFQVVDARKWVLDLQTEKEMQVEWVFAGSGFWEDPEDKREYYRADSGDMICVSNFSSAMLDVAIPSSADAGSLRFVPFEAKIPEPDTPVRLVLAPVPDLTNSEDTSDEPKPLDLPAERDVPRAK